MNLKNILLSAFTALLISPASAQNFSYDVQLKSVSFSGTQYLNIRPDDGSTPYAAPHWQSSSATQKPVAYVSGSSASVSAILELNCANAPASVQVRGKGSDSIDFPVQTISIPVSGSSPKTINYPVSTGARAFTASTVRYFPNFRIDWEISFDAGSHWYPAGSSLNPIYVTKSAPAPENAMQGYLWFRTLYHLSCANANRETTDTGIISKTWLEFVDHDVRTWDSIPLNYYQEMFSSNSTTQELLRDKNGQCYCWAHIYIDLLKIQGITRTNNYINIRSAATSTACGTVGSFFVKDWTFSTPTDSMSCTSFPYKNVYGAAFYSTPSHYAFAYEEVHDQIGAIGQTAPNPASYFSNHQIAYINGKYYDPSYGFTYNTLADIKGAIDAWGIRSTSNESVLNVDVDGDGVKRTSTTAYLVRVTRNLSLSNFSQTTATY